jgi:hypothetical protein
MSELRWNSLLWEWLATATEWQDRTFLPPPDSGAGMFINDTLAEEKAAELRNLVGPVVWKGGQH